MHVFKAQIVGIVLLVAVKHLLADGNVYGMITSTQAATLVMLKREIMLLELPLATINFKQSVPIAQWIELLPSKQGM